MRGFSGGAAPTTTETIARAIGEGKEWIDAGFSSLGCLFVLLGMAQLLLMSQQRLTYSTTFAAGSFVCGVDACLYCRSRNMVG